MRAWIPRCHFDRSPDAALGGHLCQQRQVVERAVAVWFEAEGVGLGGPDLGHDIQIGSQAGLVGVRTDHHALAQGDTDAAVVHRGQQVPPEPNVILE